MDLLRSLRGFIMVESMEWHARLGDCINSSTSIFIPSPLSPSMMENYEICCEGGG